MRKNALILCCFTCAAGAIGAFCRWLQNQLAFDKSGLSVPSFWNYIVPLVILAAAICFYSFVAKYKRSGLVMSTDFYDTFNSSNPLFIPAAWIIGILMIIGAMILIATCADNLSTVLYRILAGLGLLSGISFGLTAVGARRKYEPGLVCVFVTAPIIQFCLWLIASYKQNSTNPTVWVYAVEILAIAAALLAFYYFAGYPYGRAKPYNSLYLAMLGAFLGIVALADDRNFGLQLMLVSAISMQLLWACMIVSHRRKPAEPEPDSKTVSGAAPAAAPETDASVNSIIEEFRDGEQK